jgi:type IV secretory pathway TrbF-like protein
MAPDILSQHQKLVRDRSRSAWLEYAGRSRMREMIAYILATLMTIIAIISISLARYTASSVIVQNNVRTVDRFGQLIGQTGAVYRIPANLETHAFLSRFVTDVFTVYGSAAALQRNYAEAQAATDGRSPVGGILKDFWSQYSPLRSDLTWNAARDQEQQAEITSILDRGRWSQGGEEFEVDWTVSPVLGDGHLGGATLYKGDIALIGGAQHTDANPWGLLATHFSWSTLR